MVSALGLPVADGWSSESCEPEEGHDGYPGEPSRRHGEYRVERHLGPTLSEVQFTEAAALRED